jgi:preprotein translocase subunit Sss1
MSIILEGYHTQGRRNNSLMNFPGLATGNEQWLGDGYYFWQDYEFAEWWGRIKKCGKHPSYDVYKTVLNIDDDTFLDTVFNEKHYRFFVRKIEEFAKKYKLKTNRKPDLEEFNEFICDHNIWEDVLVIRFQDVPENNDLVEVRDFYYKKRIQLVIREAELITNFVHHKNYICK